MSSAKHQLLPALREKPVRYVLAIILIFAFLTRFVRLQVPQLYIFDEVYHVVTAKLISHNDPRAFEWWHPAPEPNTAIDWLHPPLAKYTQALSMKVFGENSFGWRASSALFGVGVVALTHLVTTALFAQSSNSKISQWAQQMGLVAALLASFDGLLLVQSRIAMNDIHVTFFILLSLFFYAHFIHDRSKISWLWLTGLGAGLAMGSKWSGVFVIGIVGLSELSHWLKQLDISLTSPINQSGVILKKFAGWIPVYFATLIALPVVLYLLSYIQMFLQGKGWSHFWALHKQIWAYQTGLTATHSYQSRPFQWFLDLRPVWFHVEYTSPNTIANIYTFGNPALFWFGAVCVIFTCLYLILQRTKYASSFKHFKELGLLLLAYVAVWLPWQLSPRIMFFYHYTPAVPLLTIIVAYWLVRIWHYPITSHVQGRVIHWNKVGVGVVIGLIAGCFAIWYPNWTAIPVKREFANNVYFMFDAWK